MLGTVAFQCSILHWTLKTLMDKAHETSGFQEKHEDSLTDNVGIWGQLNRIND